MTVVSEKTFKIDIPYALGILLEAYFLYKRLVVCVALVYRVVNAAEVDKIERASSHNEQRVGVVVICGRGKVVYDTALVGKLELADAR